jgi:nitrogen regulatory protein P-II 1
MKKIEAVLHPDWLDGVKHSLVQAGVPGMTVTQVRSLSAGKGNTLHYRGVTFTSSSAVRFKIEVVVADGAAEAVVEVLCEAARAGGVENGEILVLPISQVIHVRTGKCEFVAPPVEQAADWGQGWGGLPAFACNG